MLKFMKLFKLAQLKINIQNLIQNVLFEYGSDINFRNTKKMLS